MKDLSIKHFPLRRVLSWLLSAEGDTIIRIGTEQGAGWVYANYSVDEFWYDTIPMEFEKFLDREVISIYEDGERGNNLYSKCMYLKPALCLIIEGKENGHW